MNTCNSSGLKQTNDRETMMEILLVAVQQQNVRQIEDLKNHWQNDPIIQREVLVSAARQNDVKLLKKLFGIGMQIEQHKVAVLEASAIAGAIDCVIFVKESVGIDNEDCHVALFFASAESHVPVIKYLHETGVETSYLDPRISADLIAMSQEITSADEIYRPSKFWSITGDINHRMLRWGGMKNLKRTVNQSYFNFIPSSITNDLTLQMFRLLIAVGGIRRSEYCLVDPDNERGLWFTFLPYYQIFQGNRWLKKQLYKMYVCAIHKYLSRSQFAPTLEFMEEPEHGNPVRIFRDDGKLISQDVCNAVSEFRTVWDSVAKKTPGVRPVVGELGAGYGRLAHVFLSCTRARYLIFDIPPALAISQNYLAKLFPNRRIFEFRSFDRFEEIRNELENADVAFFTSNQLEKFPDGFFDGFLSISALHEMTKEQIDWFLKLVDQKTQSVFYMKNYRVYQNPHDDLLITSQDYKLPARWGKELSRPDRLNPRFFETLYSANSDGSERGKAFGDRLVVEASEPPKGATPTVSVLLANFNHEHQLQESLGAICSQTRPPDEIIVIDDASTDDSVAVIESFQGRHKNFVLIVNDRNKGPVLTVNDAVKLASSDYIVWASSDDKLLPEFIERNVDMLSRHPGAGLSFSRLAVFETGSEMVQEFTDGNHGPAFDMSDKPHFLSAEDLRDRVEFHYLWMSGNTVVARRDALIEAGGFWSRMRWHADWFTFYIVALRYGVCLIPETLALIRKGHETYSGSGMRSGKEQRAVMKTIVATLRNPAFSDMRRVFRARPCLWSPFGFQLLQAEGLSVINWDLCWRFGHWLIRRKVAYSGVTRYARYRRKVFEFIFLLMNAVTPNTWKRV